MNKDQKQVLKAIGSFVLFKALLYISINRAAKALRETTDKYDPHFGHTTQFGIKTGTDIVGIHAKVDGKRRFSL